MGSEKVKIIQSVEERQETMQRMLRDLRAMEIMLERGFFESDTLRIGAEQEMTFVGPNWRPAPIVVEVLEKIADPHFTTEYARFNMELNLDPVVFTGDCLSTLDRQLRRFLERADEAARHFGAHIVLVGIPPTLHRSDINLRNLTPMKRYKDLTRMLQKERGGMFEFRIEGPDELITKDYSSLFEASCTSFQVHYQTIPEYFVADYNWSLAVTAPLMSCATNSPILLGKRLWRETRIALFQQSVDTRSSAAQYRDRSPRVGFGDDWLRHSVLEIFRNNVARYQPLLSSTRGEDPLAVLEEGGIPKLYALNVHSGTLYPWNRACYGISDTGRPHLRIENRVLPAGPSVLDEISNAAFWLGMMKGRSLAYGNIAERMDFHEARENFQRAARQGLGAQFKWPGHGHRIASEELILKELLPLAREGLQSAGVLHSDIDRYLGVIEERTRSGRTGSQWLLDTFEKLKKFSNKSDALVGTTAAMYRRQEEGREVSHWDLPDIPEIHLPDKFHLTIEQVMVTNLFTVSEDDPVDFVAQIMNWHNIRHIPVENQRGQIVGLITSKQLIRYFSEKCMGHEVPSVARQIMTTEPLTVEPATLVLDAIRLMENNDVGCLPVVKGKKLVGLVTEHDFVRLSAKLLSSIPEKSR